MHRRRRITALALLAGLLALPLLGLAAPDACCMRVSPCASSGEPCESLGPVPCCPSGHGLSDAPAARTSAPPDACIAPPLRFLALERASGAQPGERGAPGVRASALRLSVVLRI